MTVNYELENLSIADAPRQNRQQDGTDSIPSSKGKWEEMERGRGRGKEERGAEVEM